MLDQLKAMAVFRKVVQTGTFRAAARSLDLSPSVVSHHVAQLESRLGTPLLYRSTRRLSLTTDGHRLFEASSRMVEAAEAGLDAVRQSIEQPSGRLKVAVTGTVFESPPFISHLAAFARAHPKVDLALNFSDQKVELVGSDFDAAIRIGWLEDSRYKTRKLCELDLAIIASPDYLAGRPLPRRIEDLDGFDWIKLEQLSVSRQLTDASGEGAPVTPNIAIEVDSVAALRQMALEGLGATALPRFLVAEQIAAGRLIELEPRWPLMPVRAYLVWPNNVPDNSLTHRFVDFLVRATKPE